MQGPASSTSATLSPSCSTTCSALVGLSRPERLALGAAIAPAERSDHVMRDPARRAKRDRRKARRHQRVHRRAGRKRRDERERPRPERFRQQLGAHAERPVAARHRHVGDVADQRIEARPALGGEDFCYRLAVLGVRGEPVDRLRRQRHELAARQRLRGFGDRRGRIGSGQNEMAHVRVSPARDGASSIGV